MAWEDLPRRRFPADRLTVTEASASTDHFVDANKVISKGAQADRSASASTIGPSFRPLLSEFLKI
jgi:hypothetical protein